jgi:hypothetical protein
MVSGTRLPGPQFTDVLRYREGLIEANYPTCREHVDHLEKNGGCCQGVTQRTVALYQRYAESFSDGV